MKTLLLILSFIAGSAAFAVTPDNDDSCDIAVLPAATLLLPYFEVSEPWWDRRVATTTRFSITNVTNLEQVAQVTIWTDRGYPVLSFNVHLTGYDVESIDLYDVLMRAVVVRSPPSLRRGRYSDPNAGVDVSGCSTNMYMPLDVPIQELIWLAFEGKSPSLDCRAVASPNNHSRGKFAAGYVTIDVVDSCTSFTPADDRYWREALRYDNVLVGDYQQIDVENGSAQGGPLVHIRAIPEGGTPAERRGRSRYDAGFQRTFYERFQDPSAPHLDARQPLPAQFAARWIGGSASESGTTLKVWREASGHDDCRDFHRNAELDVTEVVVFDENENAVATPAGALELPVTSLVDVADAEKIPQLTNGASAGWIYLNLDRYERDGQATQNWVVTSVRAHGRFSADSDAAALGNGCTPETRASGETRAGGTRIAPAPNDNGPALGVAEIDNDASCDIAVQPAATLLLPYFEVDLDDAQSAATIFTITNVSPSEQIARVTLWTDLAYPVTSFNIVLTGYDVQSLSLYDILARGVIGPDGGAASARQGCESLPRQLTPELVQAMAEAFVHGQTPATGSGAACDSIGLQHVDAIGYATVDVVRNCATNGPTSPQYWSDDLAFDNVLIGDYQHLSSRRGSAESNPMVHIRAIPEGGTAAERLARPERYGTKFPRTFYSRFQDVRTPALDGRQPLPSTFAARWTHSRTEHASFTIWREGTTGIDASCGKHAENEAHYVEIVRFDQAENAVGLLSVDPRRGDARFPATSRTASDNWYHYPWMPNGAISGWMYFNLDHCRCGQWASQNWVTYDIANDVGRYSMSFDSAALGNGCSPPTRPSEVTTTTDDPAVIGPAPNRR